MSFSTQLNVLSLMLCAALGESILGVIGCLVAFLETDVLHSLPYTVATTLAVFPTTLHRDVVELLCTNLLPVTLGTRICRVLLVCLFLCDVSASNSKTKGIEKQNLCERFPWQD